MDLFPVMDLVAGHGSSMRFTKRYQREGKIKDGITAVPQQIPLLGKRSVSSLKSQPAEPPKEFICGLSQIEDLDRHRSIYSQTTYSQTTPFHLV